jgi:serine/threonine protein kinase
MKKLKILSSWLRLSGFKREALKVEDLGEAGLDEEGLRELINLEEEEARLKESKENNSPYVPEDLIPTSFDNLGWSAQWEMGEHKDSDLKRLKDAGIIPVAAEAKTLIGYGSYGRVYNVIWNGKPAVAKVGQKSDGEAWSKILAIRDSLPAQSQKHLGAVYDIIDSPPGSIIVMKKLIPLTSEYNRYWNVGSFKRPIEDFSFSKFEELYNPEELMKWFEAELLLWLPEKFRGIELPSISEVKEKSNKVKPKPHSISDLKKISPDAQDLDLFNHFKKGKKDYWKKSLKLSLVKKNKDLIGKAKEASKEAYSPETKEILDTLSGSLEYYAERYVNNLYDNINISNYITDSFPQNWREDKDDIEVHPKLQSFYDMIKQLQGKGIFWSDLKSDNVMLDPYGEELTLVLTDVGNFAMQN